jgi:dTMP kinase
MVENYLSGKYGGADDVDPRVASIFYAIDRYDASMGIKKGLAEGRVIVCNRYVSASMGHQGGKIHDKSARDEYIHWLEELEFDFFKIPKPDMTILLYVPYKTAQRLVENKGYREYIGGIKKDIHEENRQHLIDAEQAFKSIAEEKNWNVIDCTKGDGIMGIEEIHGIVWSEVSKFLENSGMKPSRQGKLNEKDD